MEVVSEADKEVVAKSEKNQHTQRPWPCPHMCNCPLKIHDVGEIETSKDNERETLEPIDEEGHTVEAEPKANLIPEIGGAVWRHRTKVLRCY